MYSYELLKITSYYLFHINKIWKGCSLFHSFFFKIIFIFRQGGRREKERERNISVWKKHWLVASHTLPAGDQPTTQARALTRNRISDLLVRRLVLNPLSHPSQDSLSFLISVICNFSFFLISLVSVSSILYCFSLLYICYYIIPTHSFPPMFGVVI